MREQRASEARDLPEVEAVRRAQRGDAAAFERLYRLHSRRVFGLCLHMVKNPVEAEDLTQETFLKVFRRIRTFRGGSTFATWLYRVTVNQVLMRLRKKTPAQISLEEITENSEETGAARHEPGGPDLGLNGSMDRLALERAVEQVLTSIRYRSACPILAAIASMEIHLTLLRRGTAVSRLCGVLLVAP